MDHHNRLVVGVAVGNGRGNSQHHFSEKDIMSVEMWKPKSNYNTPLFHTINGSFTILTTMEECVAAFPDFCSLDGNNLVNIRNVSRFKTGSYGGIAYFRNSELSTGINIKTVSSLDDIVEQAKRRKLDTRSILVAPILNLNTLGEGEFISVSDVFYIDMWEPKKNYNVPRFYTKTGVYTVGLTLQKCKDAIPYFYPAYNGNIINLDLIDQVDKDMFGYTVRFRGTEFTSPIARNRAEYLLPLLKKRS
ncbi:hypothetical protein M2444_005326 [Paenibacillus sp. PastF-3]|uniref:hypothetical protein n=1 Tax=Paenibacillus sp. PastF-3 TaxID=2940626 RepID=UPI00247505F1|nr:hypothetical protein [Paenibacillus sp. PastF-3]MDH6373494.1 hypothetical protein [Paenibacillus sp. PastF-3]